MKVQVYPPKKVGTLSLQSVVLVYSVDLRCSRCAKLKLEVRQAYDTVHFHDCHLIF